MRWNGMHWYGAGRVCHGDGAGGGRDKLLLAWFVIEVGKTE